MRSILLKCLFGFVRPKSVAKQFRLAAGMCVLFWQCSSVILCETLIFRLHKRPSHAMLSHMQFKNLGGQIFRCHVRPTFSDCSDPHPPVARNLMSNERWQRQSGECSMLIACLLPSHVVVLHWKATKGFWNVVFGVLTQNGCQKGTILHFVCHHESLNGAICRELLRSGGDYN